MPFFDDSHVTDVGLRGSLGPEVGVWDMVEQAWTQQFEVDSQLALTSAIHDKWQEQLTELEARTGRSFRHRGDPAAYGDYISFIETGQTSYDKTPDFFRRGPRYEDLQAIGAADRAIQELGDPELKSFSQLLQEIYSEQRKVEERTASMSARAGTAATLGGFAGAMAGSFTMRDPLNIVTLPIGGGGRTIATRIASEMAVAGGVTAATEVGYVQPNRARAGLPERSLAFDVAAAAAGAGVIRGGFEGLAAGTRRLRERSAQIELDFNDNILRQMFDRNVASPRARAADKALDDVQFVERYNPYGEGQAANARFIAELQDVQRVMGGAPQTAIARVLPPVPFEFVEKAADFQIVKEMNPDLWVRFEGAQTRVQELNEQIANATTRIENLPDAVRLVDPEAAAQLDQLAVRVNDETLPEPERAAADLEANTIIQRVGPDRVAEAVSGVEQRTRQQVHRARREREAANKRYYEVYREVEAEAEKLRAFQRAYKGEQQDQAVGILGRASAGRVFVAPQLAHDYVRSTVDEINAFHDTLDDKSMRLFQKQEVEEVPEGVEKPEPEPVYKVGDGKYDIGLREPVDGEFRFMTEDGDLSVADAMRDLDEDVALEEAMRTCLL